MNEKKRRSLNMMWKYYGGGADDRRIITGSASGNIATFETNLRRNLKSLVVNIQPIQTGSGDPSPTNIRPISGWTGVNVTRSGKNLYQTPTSGRRTNSGINWTYNSDGTVTASGTATGNSWSYGTEVITVTLPQGTYTASVLSPFGLVVRDFTNNVYFYNGTNSSHTFTITEPTEIAIYARVTNGTTIDATTGIQLEVGTTATTYEPYDGTTYSVTLPASAGTVYGGTLDVVNGTLTVTHTNIRLTSTNQTWTATKDVGTGLRYYAVISPAIDENATDILCSHAVYSTGNEGNWGTYNLYHGRFAIKNNDGGAGFTSLADFKTWLDSQDFQICYPLATPLTYTLTPTEIRTLIGTNNIWADAGPVSVEYYKEV